MSSEPATRIENIFASRSDAIEKTVALLARITAVSDVMVNIQHLLPEIGPRIKDIPEKLQPFDQISRNVADYLRELNVCRDTLDQHLIRLRRKTLNIGIVGRPGQGKSTFLQCLTGLDDSVIPTSELGHCTGAPSSVTHHDSDETYAQIKYFNEAEFMTQVILPAYEKIGTIGAGPCTLDEFAVAELPEALPETHTDKATAEEFLKRLKFRKENLSQYRPLLQGKNKKNPKIPVSEIRNAIAQEDESQQKLCHWLAVNKAAIYCRFPNKNPEVKHTTVCDTPGLGNFIAGEQKQLIKNIGDNLDIVLFLRRPDTVRAEIFEEDTGLYDLVSRAFPELPVAEWSYFIINKTPENQSSLDFFKSQLQKSPIRVREILTVNCKNPSEVSQCYDDILDDVINVFGNRDDKIYQIRSERCRLLLESIMAFTENELMHFFPKPEQSNADTVLVHNLFNEPWERLTEKLELLRERYQEMTENDDAEFLGSLEKLRKRLEEEQWASTPEDLQKVPKNNRQGWFDKEQRRIRIRLSEILEGMSQDFGERFDRLRQETKDCLCADDGGKLGEIALTTGKDMPENKKWWQGLQDEMAATAETNERHPVRPRIVEAIRRFQNATLSFAEFMRPRVRRCLNCLEPGNKEARDFMYESGDESPMIIDKLRAAVQKAYSNACVEIEKLKMEPTMALFGAIEEFVDTSFAEGLFQRQWEELYFVHRGEIWSDRFKTLAADQRLMQRWFGAIDHLRSVCR